MGKERIAQKKEGRKKIILIQKRKNGDHKRQEEFGVEDREGGKEEERFSSTVCNNKGSFNQPPFGDGTTEKFSRMKV